MTRAVQEAQAKFRDRVDEVQDACWAAMAVELDRLGIPRHEIERWDEMQDAIRAYLKIMVTQAAWNAVAGGKP